MTSYEERLATFTSWPHILPTSSDLAAAGFQYVPTTSCPDTVKCIECLQNLYEWQPEDDPLLEHIRFIPDCQLANKLLKSTIKVRRSSTEQNFQSALQMKRPLTHREVTAVDRAANEAVKVAKTEKKYRGEQDLSDASAHAAELKAEEIGYFDPTTGNKDGYVIYKDVYRFKNRIEHCLTLWSDEEVKKVIPACLRGDALKWYVNELSSDKKALLVRAKSSHEWVQALIERFKTKVSTTSEPTQSSTPPATQSNTPLTRTRDSSYRNEPPTPLSQTDSPTAIQAGPNETQSSTPQRAVQTPASPPNPQVAIPPNTYESELLARSSATWPLNPCEISPPAICAAAGSCHKSSPSYKLPPPTNGYGERIITFKSSWPADCPTPEAMAKAGYHSTEHASDTFACIFCRVVFKARKGMDPLLLHKAYNSRWEFLTRKAAEEEAEKAVAADEALRCRRCLAEFPSNSQLHQHIRESHRTKMTVSKAPLAYRSIAQGSMAHKLPSSQLSTDGSITKATATPTAAETSTASRTTSIAASGTKSAVSYNLGVSQLVHPEITLTTPAISMLVSSSASAMYTTTNSTSANKSQLLPKCKVSPLLSVETSPPVAISRSATPCVASSATPATPSSARGATSRSVIPPPTRQANSSPPRAYQPKSYLTVQDLYERYASQKAVALHLPYLNDTRSLREVRKERSHE